MSLLKKIPRSRSINNRQRQRLIDACISALHVFGPSRTTVEKVVAIAKMSPGIVRFYFDSKASMLVASLQFLATEFEEQVLVPVAQLKNAPVLAVESLVRLYLDPAIASTRKVSVWYSFWGEASSRQEYYDICGQKDESFAILVHELIQRLIQESQQTHLDADAISLGLIGVLEILWQNFAFQAEKNIDRSSAHKRAMAYLSSVFPSQFAAYPHPSDPSGGALGTPRWPKAFSSDRLFEMEKDQLFRPSWQIVGLKSTLRRPGDFFNVDLGTERALVLKDQHDSVQALRNCCPVTPHTLTLGSAGRLEGVIRCPVHNLTFELDGKSYDKQRHLDLFKLELQSMDPFVAIGSSTTNAAAFATRKWVAEWIPAGLRSLGATCEYTIEADWKIVVEDWLAVEGGIIFKNFHLAVDPVSNTMTWTISLKPLQQGSVRLYRKIVGNTTNKFYRFFASPNQLFELGPDGLSIAQVRPTTLGNCNIRVMNFTRLEISRQREARIARYLATRLSATLCVGARRRAHSTQDAVVEFGYPLRSENVSQAVAAFRRYLSQNIPDTTHP